MGILGSLFTAFTAPQGSTAYVIIKKGGGTLKKTTEKKDGTYSFIWNSGSMDTLNGCCLYWNSTSEAKEFALSHGLELSEIEIAYRQVV